MGFHNKSQDIFDLWIGRGTHDVSRIRDQLSDELPIVSTQKLKILKNIKTPLSCDFFILKKIKLFIYLSLWIDHRYFIYYQYLRLNFKICMSIQSVERSLPMWPWAVAWSCQLFVYGLNYQIKVYDFLNYL